MKRETYVQYTCNPEFGLGIFLRGIVVIKDLDVKNGRDVVDS
jgi:hypothetical protein